MCSCKVKTSDPEKSFTKNAPKTFPRFHPDSTGGDLSADQTRSEFWCHHIDPAGDIYRNPGGLPSQDGGVADFVRIQETMREGRMPGEELLDVLLIAIAGLVLITPGFITDVVGFLLLFPFTRMLAKNWLKERMRAKSTFRDEDDVIIHQ